MPSKHRVKQKQLDRLSKAFEPEDLHEDLVPYVEEGDAHALGWPMLRHPLVFQIPYLPTMNRLCNEQYRHKRKQVRQAMDDGDYHHVVWLHERPYRPRALWDLAGTVGGHEKWLRGNPDLVLEVWIDTEFPHQVSAEWRAIFGAFTNQGEPRAVLAANEDDHEFVRRLAGRNVTVYRGHQSHTGRRGFSYSLDWEVAEFFARRFAQNKTPEVSQFSIEGSKVIGYSNARSESEIIALPEHVNHIRTVKL